MPDASYTFLSFVRQGIAARTPGIDTLGAGGAPALLNSVTLPITLRVNEGPAVVSVSVQVYGPGDVVGIDPRVVIRTEPRQLAADFEPNYFPAVDFDPPDFPWLFTPVGAADQDRLRPWICLLVIPREQAKFSPGRPLPYLSCARTELPDLRESWAWAHAQVAGVAEGEDVKPALTRSPELNLSRLVSSRKLEPKKQYYAFLVPTFEAGRQAGLGLPVSSTELLPAWPSPGETGPDEITLPVYYHWEFGTGAAADFESLVRLLQPQSLPGEVGLRDMDVHAPGLGLPPAGGVIGLEGALRTPQTRPTVWPDANGVRFQDELKALLNKAEESLDEPAGPSGPATGESRPEPVVAPPIYGHWHAGQRTLDSASPAWLRELNLDPRHRAAAGFGTRVVQDQQEQLMASAWEQLGEIERANQLLRQAQLARAVGLKIHEKRLAKLRADVLAQVTGPVHARVRIDAYTLRQHVRESALPESAVAASFRRVTRPRGPILRRLLPLGERRMRALVGRLASRAITPVVVRDVPTGMVSLDAVSESIRAGSLPGRTPAGPDIRFQDATVEAIRVVPSRPLVRSVAAPGRRSRRGGPPLPGVEIHAADRFKDAAIAHQAHIMQALTITPPAPKPIFRIEETRPKLLEQLDPRITIRERFRLRIDTGTQATWEREDPLEPVMAYPQFPQPMIEPLQELSQDLVLPGLELVPVNSITLLEPNSRFIEAYMVGLNHEMSREMLWREFPTDQRGTYFRQFWDVRGSPLPPDGTEPDIPDLRDWHDDLGEHVTGVAAERLIVLLIRGELLRRYPNTTVYALKAEWSGNFRRLTQQDSYPLFRGRLEPDVTFVGFNLSLDEARGADDPSGEPGWYFVLQQQPTEPRFGFDLESTIDVGAITSWNDLAWPHILASQPMSVGPYLSLAVEGALKEETIDTVKWGVNSAHMARIALQQPVRIAIHASGMLGELGRG
jgi:hypothetical protein